MRTSTLFGSFVTGLFLVLGQATTASALMLTDPSASLGDGHGRVGPVFSTSSIDYEFDTGTRTRTAEVERSIFGVEFSYGMSADIDILAHLALIMKTEIEDVDGDGDGITFGFGIRNVFHRSGRIRVTGYGLFSHQAEDVKLDNVDVKIKMEQNELHIGSAVAFLISPTVAPYVGLELVPYDDGETKLSSGGSKNDFERDDMLNLKLGADLNFAKVVVRPEATLLGEKTFTISATFNF